MIVFTEFIAKLFKKSAEPSQGKSLGPSHASEKSYGELEHWSFEICSRSGASLIGPHRWFCFFRAWAHRIRTNYASATASSSTREA